MILSCPNCQTRFHLDVAALGDTGRNVRCANCRHVWFAEPPEDAPREVADDRDFASTFEAAPPIFRTRRPAVARATSVWILLSLLVLGAAALVVGRQDVVTAFPRTAALYERIGLPVQVDIGLELSDVAASRLFESGVSILVVEGTITNVSQGTRAVPQVRVALLGEKGRELFSETVAGEAAQLSAGERTTFTARLIDPPPEASNFRVSLVTGG